MPGDRLTWRSLPCLQVRIVNVTQLETRVLLVNVSAVVKMPAQADQQAAKDNQDLSADLLIQRLVEDPNTFLRTTKTLGADSVTVTDVTLQINAPRSGHVIPLHAVLWPTLIGGLLLIAVTAYTCRRTVCRHRRGSTGWRLPFKLNIQYYWGRWSARHSHTSSSDCGASCGQDMELELQDFPSPLAASYATRLRNKQMATAGAGASRDSSSGRDSRDGSSDVYSDMLRGSLR
jgi:hypothetical protein